MPDSEFLKVAYDKDDRMIFIISRNTKALDDILNDEDDPKSFVHFFEIKDVAIIWRKTFLIAADSTN